MTNNSITNITVDTKAAAKAAKAESRAKAKAAKAAAKAAARVMEAVAAVVALIRALIASGDDISMYISRENKKLQPDENTDFIIWNLPAIFTCPFRTILCTLSCYAVKAEKYRKNVLPARVRNYLISRRADFVDVMTAAIMKIAANSKKKYIIVRIHESGDFYNRAYAEKWLQIMRNCSGDKRIKFIAYTKSFPYFDGVRLPKNFSLRASIWDDTPEAMREIVKRNDWSIYTAVPEFKTGDNFTRCRCNNCAGCRHCWQNYKDIRCKIH